MADRRFDMMRRLARILDRANDFGIAAIVGILGFGRVHRVCDEEAVKRAVQNAVKWIVEENGYTNVPLKSTMNATPAATIMKSSSLARRMS
jgi:hypothetical protein